MAHTPEGLWLKTFLISRLIITVLFSVSFDEF
jgi:hypothetical protein